MRKRTGFLLLTVTALQLSCTEQQSEKVEVDRSKLFVSLPSSATQLDFTNTLDLSEDFDVFRYRNYYNGGGVAIGDINNDSLPDIYLSANTGENKLYLNQGNFTFKDITSKAGVSGTRAWATGVSMADVNSDGFLDIYVCNSGNIEGDDRENELFINNGDNTFTESAQQYGLADKGYSTHAVFFDYDGDNDLDCYVLNNSFRPIATFTLENIRNERDELGGDKLYRNDGGTFVDASEQAGIYGSEIGFGLGVTVGDINNDHQPDIYISNDFFERDYLYVNQGNGTFEEKLEQYMGHTSLSSMGADMADINKDGLPEIFVTDMLPEDDKRLKTTTNFTTYDTYQRKLQNGYYHQIARNTLHFNLGNGQFSELGQLAGVNASDWSWGALMVDLNNDTNRDIFVCNGIYKDVTNQDFIQFLSNNENIQAAMRGEEVDFNKFIEKMPSQKLSNYLFTLDSNFLYKNVSQEWGLAEPSFSNGSAYGDLDNDGDLDLIVNNVNQPLFAYENQTSTRTGNAYLKVNFRGEGKNYFGLGAKLELKVGDEIISHEHMPMRGFQSSMSYTAVVGLGNNTRIDTLRVTWPDGREEVQPGVKANQEITLEQQNANFRPITGSDEAKAFSTTDPGIDFAHEESNFNDFDRQRLIYHMNSTEGPAMAKGDVNRDGLEDLYLGGARGQAGAVYIQQRDGTFKKADIPDIDNDRKSEDVDATFFDADNDGDLDLYVVSGSSEFGVNALDLQDRLYRNDSRGTSVSFFKTNNQLPVILQAGSAITAADYDNDGDQDLFLGTRLLPFRYGVPPNSYLLKNDGKGNFKDVTEQEAPDFEELGMITDAEWLDANGDNQPELVISGEWMPISVFQWNGSQLVKQAQPGLAKSNGWWNRLAVNDIDDDGDLDIIAGNWGLNTKFKATAESPLLMYVNDFDQNRSVDQIFCYTRNDSIYPIHTKQDLEKQIIAIRKKYLYHKDYAGKTILEIFPAQILDNSIVHQAYQFNTSILRNDGAGNFTLETLPRMAQLAPVFGISVTDYNADGQKDIILTGNFFDVKPEEGRYDANTGIVLEAQPDNSYQVKYSASTGLFTTGQVRRSATLETTRGIILVLARNDEDLQVVQVEPVK